jgi:hypothetical protein
MQHSFKGIQPNPNGAAYSAGVTVGGRRYHAGSWPTAREAAIAHDRLRLHLGATPEELNLPEESSARGPASAEELNAEARLRRHAAAGTTSRYLGVSFVAATGKWCAQLQAEGKYYGVAGYPTERDAAIARDRLALHAKGRDATLNFPALEVAPASPAELRLELGRAAERRRSSRYLGVAVAADKGLWTARIYVGGQNHAVYGYKTQRAAAEARDRMALFFLGSNARLNFPKLALEPASPEKLQMEQRARYKKGTGSRYLGVTAFPQRQLAWCAEVTVGKCKYLLGYWETERAAAIAVDRARLFYADGREIGRGHLNFPKIRHRLVPADAVTLRREARAAFKARTTSKFRGVYRHGKTGGYYAKIMVDRKTYALGHYDDEVEAARAYDRAAERLLGDRAKLNFELGRGKRQTKNAGARGRRGSS